MPIINTKYNYVTQLQIDLSNNSYLNSGSGARHILTCDPSDTILEENQPYKFYLGSKASQLIHPFSQVSNCQPNIGSRVNNNSNNLIYNNSNSIFRIKIPQNVFIDPSNIVQAQKQMQKTVRTYSSNYTMNLASLTVNNNINLSDVARGKYNASDRLLPHGKGMNKGIDIKHNSYDRYLARKKSDYLKTDANDATLPNYGNYIKTKKFGLVNSRSCINQC
tara:strand:+ start:95 stop:754 length:660 start_codon:yes stop_codon:yes gene_type:complete